MDIRTKILGRNSLGLPFDWGLMDSLEQANFSYADTAKLEAGIVERAEVLRRYVLEPEATLHTAVIISMFSDRRAGEDDQLPHNQTNKRGWCGEEFVLDAGEQWGSLLWLAYPGKQDGDALGFAEWAAKESLTWLLKAGVVSRTEVTASWRGDRLVLHVQLYRSNQLAPVYDVLWGTTIKRGDVTTEDYSL